MTPSGAIDLGLGVLDHQLVDCEGRRCGKVDDLELEGVGSGEPKVTAIVVGVAAWRNRGPFARLATVFGHGRVVNVSWSEVVDIGAGVHLRRRADELRLGRGDDKARKLVARILGAR
jgi:hypothetical protein